jgi:hypothetical protein
MKEREPFSDENGSLSFIGVLLFILFHTGAGPLAVGDSLAHARARR